MYYYFDIKNIRGDYLECVVKKDELSNNCLIINIIKTSLPKFYKIGTNHIFVFTSFKNEDEWYIFKEITPEKYPEYFI